MATDIFITPTSGTVDFNNGVFGSVLGTIATMKVYDSLTSGNLSIQNSATSNLSGVKFLNRGNPGNVFEAYGTYGNLFTISDDLTDSIFSINNSAGLPVFDVYSNNSVYAGQYASGDFTISGNKIGIGTKTPSSKLQVNGSLIAGGVDNGSVIFYRSTNPATIGSTDAVLYVSDRSNSDWGITIDKTGFNYGLKIIVSASSPESFVINNGSTNPISFNGNGNGIFSGTVTAASFAGALTGNVTGNVSGSSGSCTGNAATATTAAACSGNAATATTAAACSGNSVTATNAVNLSTVRTNWSTNGTISAVVGQLCWKNYANNHTIFDASASTSPNGGAVNSTNPDVVWVATYPTLMGWNGANTYGVRVDSCRLADSATTAAACSGNAATATTATTATTAGTCSGNAATATTAAACSGNAATATTAAACSGNTAGTASNITAYTINQSVGTTSAPLFNNVYEAKTAVAATATASINTGISLTELSFSANTTVSFTGIQATGTLHMWTIATVGAGTAYTVTWPSPSVKWPGATAPTITSTTGKRDIYQFVTYDGGTTIYAIIVGQNL